MVVLDEREGVELKGKFTGEEVNECELPNYELNQSLLLPKLNTPLKTYPSVELPPDTKITKESSTEILVVGGGPVGLMLTIQLLRLGLTSSQLQVIDDRLEVGEYQRAILFHARTVEMFHQTGILEYIDKSKYFEKADELGYTAYLYGELKYDVELPLPTNSFTNYQVGIYQSELERGMLNLLDQKYNFQLDRGYKFLKMEKREEEVQSVLVLNLRTNQVERIFCKYLVACDGGKSELRKGSGLKFLGTSYDASLLLLDVQLNLDASILPPSLKVVTAFWQDDLSLVWVKPKFNHRFVIYYPNLVEANQLTQQQCIDIVNKTIQPYRISVKEVLRFGSTNAQERLLEQLYLKNLFFAGDSAHAHTPGGGMGVNLGLHDAYNLAFKLYLISQSPNALKDHLAQSYHLERSFEARRVILYSGKVLRNNMTPNDFFSSVKANRVQASNQNFGDAIYKQGMSENIAMTEYTYPNNPLLVKSGDLDTLVGKRFPHAYIYQGTQLKRTSIFQLVNGIQFEIFILVPLLPHKSNSFQIANTSLLNLQRRLDQCNVKTRIRKVIYPTTTTFQWNVEDLEEESLYDSDNNLTKLFKLDLNLEEGVVFILRPDGHLASLEKFKEKDTSLYNLVKSYFDRFVLI